MKTKLLFFTIALFYNSCMAQIWTTGTNIIKPVRAGNTVGYVTNNDAWLFIVSGRGQNDVMVKSLQRYKLSTNSWDTLSPHPTGLLGGATAVLKDTIYVICGVVNPPGIGQNIVYKYSIHQDTWSQAANFPYVTGDAKAVAYQDSLIYAAGGYAGPNDGTVKLYNANTNSWRSASSFPSGGRRSYGGFARTGDTLIYMCGTTGFWSTNYYNTVYVGVISQTNRAVINWTTGVNFPGQTRTFFDAYTWGNKGIIMTGGSTDNTFNTHSNECYVYSPKNNAWTQLPDKPTAWLTGQSASVELPGNVWKLICASGYKNDYLFETELFSDTLVPTGIENKTNKNTSDIVLVQNLPNPFGTVTTINYEIKQKGHVTLKVFDSTRKEVATVVNGKQSPGKYVVNFDGSNLPAGLYYYTLQSGQFSETKKMLIAR